MKTAAAVAALSALLCAGPAFGQIAPSTGAVSIAPSTGAAFGGVSTGAIPGVQGSTAPMQNPGLTPPGLTPPGPPPPGLTPPAGPAGASRDTNPASSNPNLPLPGTANPNLRAAPMVPNPAPPPPPRGDGTP
ncbi:MAG: hypothetical protein Q8T11_05555 [Elusimicrobiota bacterium]|nr:hypothetical protein [Elusimicrobiota bacterium]